MHAVAHMHFYGAALKLVGVTNTVDATYARHHNHVSPTAEQCTAGSQAQLVQLIVDGKVFFYIGVGGCNIGFGLVVVVVRHKVFHRVVGEKLAKLAVELGGEGFVVAQHQCGTVQLLYHVGHGEGLAAARHAL